MKKDWGSSPGTSLIEAVIALSILLMAFVFVFSVFPGAKKGFQLSEARDDAAFLGQTLLEQARASGFSGIAPSSGSRAFSGADDGASFSISIDYTVNVQSVSANEKDVWAVMTWRGAAGTDQMTMETLVTNP